jgi:hypothetical protein
MRTDGQTERYEEAISRYLHSANAPKTLSGLLNKHGRNKNAYTVFAGKCRRKRSEGNAR